MKKKYLIPTVKIVMLSEFYQLMAGSGTGAGQTPIDESGPQAKGDFFEYEEEKEDE